MKIIWATLWSFMLCSLNDENVEEYKALKNKFKCVVSELKSMIQKCDENND